MTGELAVAIALGVTATFMLGIFCGHVFTFVPPNKESNLLTEWIRTRHEYRMRLLAHRERWFEIEAAQPRPGEWRMESK